MTNEEAIAIFEEFKVIDDWTMVHLPPMEDAINKAIEALSDDFVKVVRCKDCKHYEFADNRAFGMPVKYCDWFWFEDVDDDDFCSGGERKGGGDE